LFVTGCSPLKGTFDVGIPRCVGGSHGKTVKAVLADFVFSFHEDP
jgi:hypothetical protein